MTDSEKYGLDYIAWLESSPFNFDPMPVAFDYGLSPVEAATIRNRIDNVEQE